MLFGVPCVTVHGVPTTVPVMNGWVGDLNAPPEAVTVCAAWSRLDHVTVVPTATVTTAGEIHSSASKTTTTKAAWHESPTVPGYRGTPIVTCRLTGARRTELPQIGLPVSSMWIASE